MNNSALFLDDQDKPLSYYGLKQEESIEFKLQANPMSDRMAKVTIINIEGEKDVLQVDTSNPASYLLNFFVLRNGDSYNTEEFDLILESSSTHASKQILSLQSLKSQGVCNGSVLRIVKKSKNEVKNARKSIANIKKKAAAHSPSNNSSNSNYSPQSSDDQLSSTPPTALISGSVSSSSSSKPSTCSTIGANLIVIEEFESTNPSMLKLKKGEQIIVIEEDVTGGIYWRGKSAASGRSKFLKLRI